MKKHPSIEIELHPGYWHTQYSTAIVDHVVIKLAENKSYWDTEGSLVIKYYDAESCEDSTVHIMPVKKFLELYMWISDRVPEGALTIPRTSTTDLQ